MEDNIKSTTNKIRIKKITITIIMILSVVSIVIATFFVLKIRNKQELEEYNHFIFSINKKYFKIGEKVSYYEKKGYTYKDKYTQNDAFVVADGFISHTFYSNDKSVMNAAIHCQQDTNCKYEDCNMIKINFYNQIGEVELAGFIKKGTSYKKIVSKLGEPDGKFYMNKNEYVWTFYEKGKIGNPYYILEFDEEKNVSGMKIGIWWYDGEYEYTIK